MQFIKTWIATGLAGRLLQTGNLRQEDDGSDPPHGSLFSQSYLNPGTSINIFNSFDSITVFEVMIVQTLHYQQGKTQVVPKDDAAEEV